MSHVVQVVAVIRNANGIYLDDEIEPKEFQVGNKPWQYRNRSAAVEAANSCVENNKHLDVDLAILVNGEMLNKGRVVYPTETVLYDPESEKTSAMIDELGYETLLEGDDDDDE